MPPFAWILYGLGIAVMLFAMTSDHIDGWAAFALWFAGLGAFVLGIVLEERGQRV